MAQDCSFSACKHRGHPAPMLSERGPTDGVYASLNAMKPSRFQAPFDGPPAEAQIDQLLPRQNIMLAPRQCPRSTRTILPPIWRSLNLPPHTVEKSATARTLPLTQPVFVEFAGLQT